ncbi:hypothetical protein PP707_00020 [Acetobacter pasteurianus]|nr:hypothetical protein [Acetobacter pasteurianus]
MEIEIASRDRNEKGTSRAGIHIKCHHLNIISPTLPQPQPQPQPQPPSA